MIKFKLTSKDKISLLICLVLFISSLSIFAPEVKASSQTFSYTGAQQTWVVPAGVTSVTVDAAGAGPAGTGSGKGGRVQTVISTTPGETLYLYVGGTAGYNGGGTDSQGGTTNYGGGATDIRQGGTALGNRVVVAGGGGRKGQTGDAQQDPAGGDGGGTTGANGSIPGTSGPTDGGYGSGGTSSAGGAGGAGGLSGTYGNGTAGTNGVIGVGGDGGNRGNTYGGRGGAGGGGYYGGGGGGGGAGGTSGNAGTGAGGGGGSSYSSGSSTTHTQGYQSSNGQIIIYYSNAAPVAPSLDLPGDASTAQSITPILKTTTTDAESDNLQYKIQICTDSGMTANCQTFDQSSSQTGWSGQDAQSSTSYASGTQAVYTVQSSLSVSTTYYWRSYAIDPAGLSSSTWGATQGTPHSFTTGASCSPSTSSVTFDSTGGQQTWVVPAGVTSVTVDASGANGQTGASGQLGGAGGRIQTTITTTPAETLYIYVGAGGSTTATGGYNGGGAGGQSGSDGGGGGGASDIRQGGTALGNRVVVAGGGGGGGGSTTTAVGGVGGGTTGGTGGNSGGTGGTQAAGGTTGGASGTGGGNVAYTSAGAGGGGYYGGGIGGSSSTGRAGGGGSSYSSGTSTTHTQGYKTGNGQIISTYPTLVCSAPNVPSLDLPADAATYQTLTPVLKTTTSDSEGHDIKYKIQICTDSGMTANCQTFDQSSSQTGWSGQNTVAGTAYTSGTQGVYTVQSALNNNTTYYWRSYAIDPSGSNTWSATQTPRSFTTKPGSCGEPVSGSYTIGTACIFTGTVNGVDAGTGNTNTAQLQIGTVGTPGNLTIWSDQTIAVGSIKLVNGSIILWGTPGQRGQIKIRTPLYLPDADGDGFPTSVTTTKYYTAGAGRVRQSAIPDCDDANNTVYPGTCNGTTACTTAGASQACSTAGICQTGGGCSAGSCTAVNNVASGQDTNSDCAASYNSCSGNNKVGPDGNCDGAGACNTGGLSSACPTAGICQTGGGCSSGSCVTVSNASAGTDPGNNCTATYNACSGTNKIGPDGNCNGSGACNTGGQSTACPFTGCHNGCSGGACVEVPNGSDYNGACTHPASYSVYTVYPGGGTCNAACSSHTTTGDNCNGSGSCQTPNMSCFGIGTDGSATNGSYALYNTVTAPSTCSTWVATGGGGCGTSMTAGNCQGCSGSGCPKQTNCKCN